MKTYNITKERAVIEALRLAFPEFKAISETELFQMRQIKNGDSSYEFGFRGTDAQSEIPQVLLTDKDLFVATAWCLVLVKQAAAKPTAIIPHSYPNKEEFGANYNDLEAFFNSLASLTINQEVVFEKVRTSCFRYVPEQIQQAAVPSVSPLRVHDNYEFYKRFRELEAPVLINGKNSNTLRINLGSTAGLTIAGPGSGTEHFVGVFLKGVSLAGAAERQYEKAQEAIRSLYSA